ncbi:MAG: right-handed parallel beta-helix repeat-containing protein [Candidatus Marinimicrobia bacterium]|nr:right-handed parallel beta-helix repeat-containing protein [Candidatus Neomarinimicrobiota bacterium]
MLLAFVLTSCSQGVRFKNLVNYPVTLSDLGTLDTLKLSPEIVRFTGSKVVSFRKIHRNIRIQGRQADRPLWTADDQGCFLVGQRAKVYISDINFQGTLGDTALIRVNSGNLILENCDFVSSGFWAIEVDSGASLELRNVHFSQLGSGAVRVRGGQVRIWDSQFDHINKAALYASGGDLLEIHRSFFRNTMGSALDINSVEEVWLDSVRILDSFQDGVIINDCEYVLINQLESRENGRCGLVLNHATICGILNFSSLGNLVNGIEINDVDTLRILNSEFIGNGQGGGSISKTQRSRVAGIKVGHNGGGGLQFSQGQELWINRSSFQANPLFGLGIDSVKAIKLDQISFVNNGHGLQVIGFDTLGIQNSLLSSNRMDALNISGGIQVSANSNLVKGNSLGLVINHVLFADLDSNQVESNQLGNDIRSISKLSMQGNVWVSNASGAYFSDIASMSSSQDKWLSNFDTGLEIFSAEELLMTGARFHNNRNGAHLTQVSVRIESSTIDSCRDVGLKLMNGSLVMHNTQAQHNGTAIELSEGSQAKITQSKFSHNELTINAGASVSLAMAFSKISDAGNGIRLGNYGEASLLSNQFNLIDGACVELSGPYIQSLKLRQNVISQTGGILTSQSLSGDIQIQSNTFANNLSGILGPKGTLHRLDHNIFYHTAMINPQILRDQHLFRSNCFFPLVESQESDSTQSLNIFADPEFESGFHLSPNSACLNGGDGGMLIGALGSAPEDRPSLQP